MLGSRLVDEVLGYWSTQTSEKVRYLMQKRKFPFIPSFDNVYILTFLWCYCSLLKSEIVLIFDSDQSIHNSYSKWKWNYSTRVNQLSSSMAQLLIKNLPYSIDIINLFRIYSVEP